MSLYAVILTVPRVAPVRPAAAPAIIKRILSEHGKTSRVLDINIDYFSDFQPSISHNIWNEIDEYLFVKNKTLGAEAQQVFDQFINKWAQQILLLAPEKVLLSIFSWQAQRFSECLLRKLRPLYFGKIIVGGQGLIREENGSFSTKPTFAHYLRDAGLIDHWIRGEAETTLPAIIQGNYSVAGIDTDFFADRSNVLEHQPWDFSDFDIRKYRSGYDNGVLPMESSRGCLRNCAFCDIPTIHNGYRPKSGDQLADEMIHYYETHGVKDFFFHDALCNGSVKDFRQFNLRLIKYYETHNLPDRYFRYSSHAIVHKTYAFKPRDFEIMARGGADTMVRGIESGSDRVLEDMDKSFTMADLDYNMEHFSRNKIQTYFLIIVGFPTETEEDFQATLDMLTRYQRYVADGTIIGVNLGTTLTIEEGTPIFENPSKFKVIGINGNRPQGPDWRCETNQALTYKERIMRRIRAQEHAVNLGYTFWKGDDQMKIMMDKYQERLRKLQGLVH